MQKKIISTLIAALLLTAACGCGAQAPVVTADPYEGMVQVDSGFDTQMWVKLYDTVPACDIDRTKFKTTGNFLEYTGDDYSTMQGIDVSVHQGEIDWQAVAQDGVQFAMIRAGYRGYSEGGLYEDACFEQNIKGALENGIQAGVYFFSQAVTAGEAVAEAEYLLELIDGYELAFPVVFDWETIDMDEARTDGLDGDTLTDCAVAFCEKIKEAGYQAGVYTYRYLGYFSYDLSRLTDYTLWVCAVGQEPDFYYRHSIWQYKIDARIDGIEGDVDLNMLFVQNLVPAQSTQTAQESTVEE